MIHSVSNRAVWSGLPAQICLKSTNPFKNKLFIGCIIVRYEWQQKIFTALNYIATYSSKKEKQQLWYHKQTLYLPLWFWLHNNIRSKVVICTKPLVHMLCWIVIYTVATEKSFSLIVKDSSCSVTSLSHMLGFYCSDNITQTYIPRCS